MVADFVGIFIAVPVARGVAVPVGIAVRATVRIAMVAGVGVKARVTSSHRMPLAVAVEVGAPGFPKIMGRKSEFEAGAGLRMPPILIMPTAGELVQLPTTL